jgi:membrane protein DedA with SNARE-associated domain
MLDILMGSIADHWLLSAYFGVMIFNESAILAAFSFLGGGGMERFLGVAAVSIAGLLTNDLALYALVRHGVGRLIGVRERSGEETDSESVFERIFLGNVFLSLLFIKFLFGIRLILTVYLVAKKRVSFVKFIVYDLCGIALYVSVLGGIGFLIGHGNRGIQGVYDAGIRTITAIIALVILMHLSARLLKRRKDTKKTPIREN